MEQLERERSENSDLKSRLHRLETEIHSYVRHEQEVLDVNGQLKGQLEHAQDDLRVAKDTLTQSRDMTDRTIAEHRVSWTEEKMNLQRRLDEQDDQLAQLHQQVAMTTTMHKRVRGQKRLRGNLYQKRLRGNLYQKRLRGNL